MKLKDKETIKTNPKIDTQLLSDYHRLTEASKGVPKRKRGANYRLSHPFGSNDVPPQCHSNRKKAGHYQKTQTPVRFACSC